MSSESDLPMILTDVDEEAEPSQIKKEKKKRKTPGKESKPKKNPKPKNLHKTNDIQPIKHKSTLNQQ